MKLVDIKELELSFKTERTCTINNKRIRDFTDFDIQTINTEFKRKVTKVPANFSLNDLIL